MSENKKVADNLKVVYNLLSQCTLPPTPVGKAGEVQKVLESFRTIIQLIDEGELLVTRNEEIEIDLPEEVTNEAE